MNVSALNGVQPALTSKWDGLNAHLLARFFAVKRQDSEDKQSSTWVRDPDSPVVVAPISEAHAEIVANWQSAFENIGPDQKFSTLSAMLQTGALTSVLQAIQKQFPTIESLDQVNGRVASLAGRSNLTKLNSMQVFNGMPPMKITLTAHFRAYDNANEEVERPIDQLIRWAVPQEIAPDGILASSARGEPSLFASKTPQIIGMSYANRLLMPLVIESIPYPLSGPRGSDGSLVQAQMQMQIATLTAIDANDWNATRVQR